MALPPPVERGTRVGLRPKKDEFNRQGIPGPTKDYWPHGSLRPILTGRAVQEAIRVHRNPASNRGRRGSRLNNAGKPLYGETAVIQLPPLFTKDELKRLMSLWPARFAGPHREPRFTRSANASWGMRKALHRHQSYRQRRRTGISLHG